MNKTFLTTVIVVVILIVLAYKFGYGAGAKKLRSGYYNQEHVDSLKRAIQVRQGHIDSLLVQQQAMSDSAAYWRAQAGKRDTVYLQAKAKRDAIRDSLNVWTATERVNYLTTRYTGQP
jgi:hypothetical protein